MRFRAQLILGVGLLIAITLAGGVLAMSTLHSTARRTNAVTNDIVEGLTAAHTIRLRAERLVSTARGYLLSGNDEYRRRLELRERELEQSLSQLPTASSDLLSRIELATVEQLLHAYIEAISRAARVREQTDHIHSLELSFERVVEPHRHALDAAINALATMERARIGDEARRTGQVVRGFGVGLLVAWSGGIAISIVLAILIARRLNVLYVRAKDAERRANEAATSRKQIVDIVAHDLLSPLNAILLGFEALKVHSGDVPYAAATIVRSAQRMQRMVSDLLDASRAEQLTFPLALERHAVDELLGAAVDLFRDRAAAENVTLRAQLSPEVYVRADDDRIVQVLSNLVGNALKFARAGDEIVVSATRREDDSTRFLVEDTGPGIPADELAHLFVPYHQGARGARRGSLGLGLFICRALVEAHGGTIGVDSEVGRGTRIWFDIPAPPPERSSAPL